MAPLVCVPMVPSCAASYMGLTDPTLNLKPPKAQLEAKGGKDRFRWELSLPAPEHRIQSISNCKRYWRRDSHGNISSSAIVTGIVLVNGNGNSGKQNGNSSLGLGAL